MKRNEVKCQKLPTVVVILLLVVYIWRVDFQNPLHPLLHVTHLQLRLHRKAKLKKILQMEIVDTNWNLE